MSPRPSLPSLAAIVATVATASVFAQGAARPAAPAAAAQAPVVVAPLSAPLPVDPQITLGRLPNGIRYYIRANKRPENRAELRLAVNAGSLLEDDDQRGLAHFVEHMAFNGTKHFPKQDITSFMEGIGMRFGRDVNAYTSFDETVFMLDVPTEKREVIDRAMLVLEDWAQGVSFDPAEIEKERGVVLEEWRLGRGADARMQDAYFPTLLKGSRYADRLPIGKPEILQNFKAERLVKFYKDWYRPDLMAVVAVGDFDPAAVESAIVAHFGPIPAAVKPRPLPVLTVADRGISVSSCVPANASAVDSIINGSGSGPASCRTVAAAMPGRRRTRYDKYPAASDNIERTGTLVIAAGTTSTARSIRVGATVASRRNTPAPYEAPMNAADGSSSASSTSPTQSPRLESFAETRGPRVFPGWPIVSGA
jgi:hypothetical protein